MVHTLGTPGGAWRLTIVCRAVTTCAAATTTSLRRRSGAAAWPPSPCKVTCSSSAEAMYMPLRTPMVPTGKSGATCCPKTASGAGLAGCASSAPASIINFAPPGTTSSLG